MNGAWGKRIGPMGKGFLIVVQIKATQIQLCRRRRKEVKKLLMGIVDSGQDRSNRLLLLNIKRVSEGLLSVLCQLMMGDTELSRTTTHREFHLMDLY